MPEEVGRPSRRPKSDQEALPEFQEASGVLLEGQKWSGGPPSWPRGVKSLSHRNRRVWEALPVGWEGWKAVQKGWEGF